MAHGTRQSRNRDLSGEWVPSRSITPLHTRARGLYAVLTTVEGLRRLRSPWPASGSAWTEAPLSTWSHSWILWCASHRWWILCSAPLLSLVAYRRPWQPPAPPGPWPLPPRPWQPPGHALPSLWRAGRTTHRAAAWQLATCQIRTRAAVDAKEWCLGGGGTEERPYPGVPHGGEWCLMVGSGA